MQGWAQFLKLLIGTLAGLLLVAAALVTMANPFGNLPFSPMRHVLMDDNQRFQYPAVVRSRRYDSIVVGTSTTRLLEPSRLEAALGGRFANLALNSGTAWEQWRVAKLFAETNSERRTLLIGADHVWCDGAADINRITPRGFPEWMFDANPWNDLTYMLNVRTLEIAGRRIGYAIGHGKERWPHNGYEVFVPPESAYNLVRARENIWNPGPAPKRPRPPAHKPDGFPALVWLSELLDPKSGWPRVIVLMPPTHQAGQAKPSTAQFATDADCKTQIASLGQRHGRPVIDWRIRSSITTEDANYWDVLHYRIPIANRVVDGLARALKTGLDDPHGDWRILAQEEAQPRR